MANGGEDAAAIFILALLHLGAYDIRGSFGLLDPAAPHSPVEDRNREGQSDDFLVRHVLEGEIELVCAVGEAEAGVKLHGQSPVGLRLGRGGFGVEDIDFVREGKGGVFQGLHHNEVEVHQDIGEIVGNDRIGISGPVQADVGTQGHAGIPEGDQAFVDADTVVQGA